MNYDLDPLETRRMYLAGTVPFPTPFPTVGTIRMHKDRSTLDIEDPQRLDNKVARTVSLTDIAAVFEPHTSEGQDWSDPRDQKCVDFAKGKWYVGGQVASVMGAGGGCESFPGIVFVAADAPVFARIDVTLSAAESCLMDLPIQNTGCLGCTRR